MRTPNLWQKLVNSFKKPFEKLFKKRDHIPEQTTKDFFRESGESVYHKMKGERKQRKKRNRRENKSRAINYGKAKK